MAGFFLFGAGFQMDAGAPIEPAWVVPNLSIAAIYAYSAASGFRKTSQCRAAIRQLEQRRTVR